MSKRYLGGVITKSPVTPNVSSANGIWTMEQQAHYRYSNCWPRSPGAPSITSVTKGNANVAVAFSAPSCTGSNTLTSYIATSNTGVSATNTTSPITVTGLTNGASYTFVVRGINSAGTGACSVKSAVAIPSTVPNAPTIGTATGSGCTAAVVTFTGSTCNGGNTITGYTVTSTPGSYTGTGASSPITVSGLNSACSYTFKVKAQNANGFGPCSSASNSVSFTLAFNGFNTPADIGTGTSYYFMNSVAVNSSGLFVAIGYDGSNYPVYATSTNGSTWSTPSLMGSGANMAMMNSVAVNSSGLFVAVGYNLSYNASYNYPLYATSTNGSNWSTPAYMNGSTTSATMNSVAVNSSGLFVAVGYDSNGYGAARYATSSDGSTWTTPAAIGSSSNFVCMKSVAVNSSGLFVAVGRTGCCYPRYATSSNGSTWTTPAAMGSGANKAIMNSVAVNSSGLFVAVGYDYNNNTPLYATSSNGSTWTTPAAMNGTGVYARMQSVAVNNAGVFVAVGYNNSYSLYATSSDGSTWTTPTQFNGSSDYILMNSVAANRSGLFVSVGINVGVGHPSYAKSK